MRPLVKDEERSDTHPLHRGAGKGPNRNGYRGTGADARPVEECATLHTRQGRVGVGGGRKLYWGKVKGKSERKLAGV